MNKYKAFAPVLMIIIALVGGYFLTYAQWNLNSANKGELIAVQAQNTILKNSEAQTSSFLNKYNSLKGQAEKIDKLLPANDSELQTVLSNMDRFAADSGVSISNISFSESAAASGAESESTEHSISSIDINVSASGTYASFRNFLFLMENNLRLYDILELDLSTSETDILSYRFVARIYYQQ